MPPPPTTLEEEPEGRALMGAGTDAIEEEEFE
jgi:hypothetical protein